MVVFLFLVEKGCFCFSGKNKKRGVKTPLGWMSENKNFSLSGKQKMLAAAYFIRPKHFYTRFLCFFRVLAALIAGFLGFAE